jgi:hypothetical protein
LDRDITFLMKSEDFDATIGDLIAPVELAGIAKDGLSAIEVHGGD